jgi:hypothetical protein
MGTRAGFHSHCAFGQWREKSEDAFSVQIFVHHALAVFIQAVDTENVLCQVDADQGNLAHGMVSFARCLCFPMHPDFLGRGHPFISLKHTWGLFA